MSQGLCEIGNFPPLPVHSYLGVTNPLSLALVTVCAVDVGNEGAAETVVPPVGSGALFPDFTVNSETVLLLVLSIC